jgi:hypothetical protein
MDLTVGEVSQRTGVAPRVISAMIYNRKLDVTRCPLVSGRRMIRADYLPEVERVLRSIRMAQARESVPTVA